MVIAVAAQFVHIQGNRLRICRDFYIHRHCFCCGAHRAALKYWICAVIIKVNFELNTGIGIAILFTVNSDHRLEAGIALTGNIDDNAGGRMGTNALCKGLFLAVNRQFQRVAVDGTVDLGISPTAFAHHPGHIACIGAGGFREVDGVSLGHAILVGRSDHRRARNAFGLLNLHSASVFRRLFHFDQRDANKRALQIRHLIIGLNRIKAHHLSAVDRNLIDHVEDGIKVQVALRHLIRIAGDRDDAEGMRQILVVRNLEGRQSCAAAAAVVAEASLHVVQRPNDVIALFDLIDVSASRGSARSAVANAQRFRLIPGCTGLHRVLCCDHQAVAVVVRQRSPTHARAVCKLLRMEILEFLAVNGQFLAVFIGIVHTNQRAAVAVAVVFNRAASIVFHILKIGIDLHLHAKPRQVAKACIRQQAIGYNNFAVAVELIVHLVCCVDAQVSLEGYHDHLVFGFFRRRDHHFHLRVNHRIKDVLEILSHVAVVIDRRSVQVQDRALLDEGCSVNRVILDHAVGLVQGEAEFLALVCNTGRLQYVRTVLKAFHRGKRIHSLDVDRFCLDRRIKFQIELLVRNFMACFRPGGCFLQLHAEVEQVIGIFLDGFRIDSQINVNGFLFLRGCRKIQCAAVDERIVFLELPSDVILIQIGI